MIQAFLDESGTNPETPVLSVAGCYGAEEQWHKFREMWDPYSASFHAKHSSSLFPKLTEAMATAGIKAVLVSVGKDTYNKSATAHFKTALGNAYSCCALSCVAEMCSGITPEKAAFVLEAGQPNLGFVKGILESMINSQKWCVGSVASAQKAQFIELHTADFVSHICSTYERVWVGKLFDLKILRHAHLTLENLEYAAPRVTSLFRASKAMRKARKVQGNIQPDDGDDPSCRP